MINERGGAWFKMLIALFVFFSILWYFFYPHKTEAPQQTATPGVAVKAVVSETAAQAPSSVPLPAEVFNETQDISSNNGLPAYREAVANGDLEGGVRLLREALKESAEPSGIKRMLARDLNSLALKKSDAGDHYSARGLLSEAAALDPRPAYIENLADMQIRLGDLKGAATTLEPLSAQERPRRTLKELYMRLGQEGYRNGSLKEAVEFFSKGLEISPGDEYFKGALAKIRAEYSVEGRMDSREGGHFLVKFEGGENATAGHLIGLLLEEAYLKVGSDLGFYPSDRIEALLYSRENFRNVTRSPSWAGAIFDGRIKIPAGGIVEKTAELESVIFHEYTHAVVHRLSGGRAPVWLNEGIAQYEEGETTGDYREKEILKELAMSGKLRLRMFEGSFMGFNSKGAYVAYLVSLSAVEHMIRDFGMGSVKRVLEGLGGGQTIDGAISSALYLNYEEFERSWLESVKR